VSAPSPGAPELITDHAGDFAETASATFSRDRGYRYALTRQWGDRPAAVFVMLNPSTADAFRADPTVTRCAAFARREQCGGLVIVNLFALRATDPRDLRKHPDPVGDGNDQFIREHCAAPGCLIIAAWGAHGRLRDRDQAVLSILREIPNPPRCLGQTAAGAPRHPLYLPRAAPLAPMTAPDGGAA
jgi:hypothetical protein